MHVPRVIQIVPLGLVAREDLLLVAAATRRRFGAQAVVMPALQIPGESYVPERGQYDADHLLAALFDRLALDVCRIIGVTGVDLFADGRNFVFGYAHMRDRVAIFSTHRLRDRDGDHFVHAARIEKALVHELGHTFQAPHCSEAQCVMRQVEHLWQLDLLSSQMCAPCAARVEVIAQRGVGTPEALFELGGSYMRRRRYGRAVAAYGAACVAAPDNPHYANDLGVALLALGERGPAARAFRRAIAMAPDLPHGYYNLGIVLRESGDEPRADDLFAAALRRDGDARQAHRYLGILHQDYFHDDARARAYFEGYVALGGDDLEVRRRLSIMRREVDRCMQVLASSSRRMVLESTPPL